MKTLFDFVFVDDPAGRTFQVVVLCVVPVLLWFGRWLDRAPLNPPQDN